MTTSADRGLLAELDGHEVMAGRANRSRLTLLTRQRRSGARPARRQREPGERRPGSRLIAVAAWLLVLAMAAILFVTYAAQYVYVDDARHQHLAARIEAGIPDVLLVIFSLLAIGLGRGGLSSAVERGAVLAWGGVSAVMNYAAADVTSPRSVLAYVMPSIAFAFTVDRVASVYRRHYLGEKDGRSPWVIAGRAIAKVTRGAAMAVLYVLRFFIDRRGTWAGVRQAIINATPLPAPAPAASQNAPRGGRPSRPTLPAPLPELTPAAKAALAAGERAGSKKAALLGLYRQHEGYGDRSRVSPIAAELGPQAGLQAGTARTYLYEHLDTGEGDAK